MMIEGVGSAEAEQGEIVDCPTCGHLLSRHEVDGIVVCQVCG